MRWPMVVSPFGDAPRSLKVPVCGQMVGLFPAQLFRGGDGYTPCAVCVRPFAACGRGHGGEGK